jgi:hypothetical protein
MVFASGRSGQLILWSGRPVPRIHVHEVVAVCPHLCDQAIQPMVYGTVCWLAAGICPDRVFESEERYSNMFCSIPHQNELFGTTGPQRL